MANEVTYIQNCTDCAGDCKTKILMPCKVCVLVDGDETPKLSYYCDFCKAYICCSKHRGINLERFLAVAINIKEKVQEIISGKPTDEKTKTSNRRNK